MLPFLLFTNYTGAVLAKNVGEMDFQVFSYKKWTLLQNGWSFVVFPLQSYGLTNNFTLKNINIYISIWERLTNYPMCAKDLYKSI